MRETKKRLEYDPDVPLFSAEDCKWNGKSYGECKAAIVARFERDFLIWILTKYEGNLSAAAKHARMDRKHLLDMAVKHGVRHVGTPGVRNG